MYTSNVKTCIYVIQYLDILLTEKKVMIVINVIWRTNVPLFLVLFITDIETILIEMKIVDKNEFISYIKFTHWRDWLHSFQGCFHQAGNKVGKTTIKISKIWCCANNLYILSYRKQMIRISATVGTCEQSEVREGSKTDQNLHIPPDL